MSAAHFNITRPGRTLSSYSGVEVAPCFVVPDGRIERFDPSTHGPAPHFWSVYLVRDSALLGPQDSGSECIADFPIEAQARLYGEAWRGILRVTRAPLGLDISNL